MPAKSCEVCQFVSLFMSGEDGTVELACRKPEAEQPPAMFEKPEMAQAEAERRAADCPHFKSVNERKP